MAIENIIIEDDLQEVSGGAWKIDGMERIGQVTIRSIDVEIKREPSKNAETLCTYPSTRWFPVYEIEQNEGVLWYRLGNHSWVAQQNGVTYKMLG